MLYYVILYYTIQYYITLKYQIFEPISDIQRLLSSYLHLYPANKEDFYIKFFLYLCYRSSGCLPPI